MPPKPRQSRVPSPGRAPVPRKTLVLALTGAAALAAVAIVLSVILSGGGKKSTTPPPGVDADVSAVVGIPQHGLVIGNPLARVRLTEYIDSSCPVCKDYELTTFPGISQEYVRTGKVKVEARVLAFVGPSSKRGRQLLLAAAKQNKAFELAELIYHNQGDESTDWLTDAVARSFASRISGLDVRQLFADADSASIQGEAARMDAEAQSDGVQATPTFVLTTPDGKRHLLGAGSPGIEPFRQAFTKALAG